MEHRQAPDLTGVDSTVLTRALYASDASLYRVVPQGVVTPGTVEELAAAVDAARAAGIPLTLRGAGTSCAGNAVGPGLVVDTSKQLTRILGLDPDAGLALVEPGVVQARLSAAGAPFGLRFGPDPSTSDRCTIGGMIGNNACGPRALGYGRTAENVVALEVIAGTGERLALDRRSDLRAGDSPLLQGLWRLVQANLGIIRTEFGRFGRQLSGYSLEHLLPEHGFDVTRFFVGSEGTLGTVTRATVRLVGEPPHRCLVVLGYPTMPAAADRMPAVLAARPTACEGLDARIIETVRRRRGASAVPELPRGEAWLFVELTGADPDELRSRARALASTADCLGAAVVIDPAEAGRWWRIRADGAGYASVALARPAHAGWEDAAVPPERLGDYLRDFDALLADHGLHGLPYGHFGDGCVHCRIDFPLDAPDGRARYRSFVLAAADLVAGYGGSMSGEHGDGRARSELLPTMYSPAALALFARVKALFDPANLLNPGVLVDPAPLDADLRVPQSTGFGDQRFAADVHRCTGVGTCVSTSAGGTMCPSYRATGAEKDSTRGRARVLQEMVNGSLVTGGWAAAEVREALDLCLACKACASECPTGVDMAAWKSRALEEAHRGRRRPLTHYTLGRLPSWLRTVRRLPGLVALANATLGSKTLGGLVRRAAGIDPRRRLPAFAPSSLPRSPAPAATGRRVVVWRDSFSRAFGDRQVVALLAVLADAGFQPELLDREACCGLTWITTGQREAAARELRRALDVLHPYAAEGVAIVGTEPSCLAVWRDDAEGLLDDPRIADVARATRTLAELLGAEPAWRPPELRGHTIVAQPHCHHAAVLGWAADSRLLAATGARVVTVPGCCGLAGNFGMEPGHYDVSVAVAELNLLPALREAGPDAIVLADGFSCRTQIADLDGRQALTLAELLAGHLGRDRLSGPSGS